jgi:hypothetical protein
MKPKYRLGCLIEFKLGEETLAKRVTGIIKRADGIHYEAADCEVKEAEILQGYRLMGGAPKKTEKKVTVKKPAVAKAHKAATDQDQSAA